MNKLRVNFKSKIIELYDDVKEEISEKNRCFFCLAIGNH